MMNSGKIVLLCFVAATVIGTTMSIKCFLCDSKYDILCYDPFDNSSFPITDCDQFNFSRKGNDGLCRKVIQEDGRDLRYIRSCADPDQHDIGHHVVAGDGTEKEGFTFCTSGSGPKDLKDCICGSIDGCNSSPIMTISSISLAFSMMTMLLLK